MLILSIETSCDETSVSVVQSGKFDNKNNFLPVEILSNVVSSQVRIHQKWGGVVPDLAAREHVKNIVPVLDQALNNAGLKLSDIDLFAATQGPGLIPALLIGSNAAKSLSYFFKKPLVGIHHIEGHIYANFISDEIRAFFKQTQKNENQRTKNYKLKATSYKLDFPILSLVVSGGHTQLVLMKKHLEYEIIGQTLDDAIGEAFDKVAKIQDLGYPGGPIVSAWAEEARENKKVNKSQIANCPYRPASPRGKQAGNIQYPNFPRPMLNSKNLDFSFSGLKTAVLYFYQKAKCETKNKTQLDLLKKFICREFEDAAIEVLVEKSRKAIEQYKPKAFLLAGGVAANKYLRSETESLITNNYPKVKFHIPPLELCGDNAAMIATAAAFRFALAKNTKNFQNNWKTLEADANLEL